LLSPKFLISPFRPVQCNHFDSIVICKAALRDYSHQYQFVFTWLEPLKPIRYMDPLSVPLSFAPCVRLRIIHDLTVLLPTNIILALSLSVRRRNSYTTGVQPSDRLLLVAVAHTASASLDRVTAASTRRYSAPRDEYEKLYSTSNSSVVYNELQTDDYGRSASYRAIYSGVLVVEWIAGVLYKRRRD